MGEKAPCKTPFRMGAKATDEARLLTACHAKSRLAVALECVILDVVLLASDVSGSSAKTPIRLRYVAFRLNGIGAEQRCQLNVGCALASLFRQRVRRLHVLCADNLFQICPQPSSDVNFSVSSLEKRSSSLSVTRTPE